MSIKVYEAYRVAKGTDPFDLLWDIKRRALAAAKAKLTPLFHDILDGKSHTNHLRSQEQSKLFEAWVDREGHEAKIKGSPLRLYSEWMQNHCPPELKAEKGVYAVSNAEILEANKREVADGVKPGALDIDTWMRTKYGAQLTRYQRDTWALDVAVTMRRYRSKFYLLPYCDRACLLGGILNFMAHDERLEDFSYWNNTDPPEEVSSQEWTWRGTVWKDLTKDELWAEYLTLDIVSWAGWTDVSPAFDIIDERQRTGAGK